MKKHKHKGESVKEQNEDAKNGTVTVHDPLAHVKPADGGGPGSCPTGYIWDKVLQKCVLDV